MKFRSKVNDVKLQLSKLSQRVLVEYMDIPSTGITINVDGSNVVIYEPLFKINEEHHVDLLPNQYYYTQGCVGVLIDCTQDETVREIHIKRLLIGTIQNMRKMQN